MYVACNNHPIRVNMENLTLSIEGLTCAGCVRRAENALNGVPGVASAQVNLANESAALSVEDRTALGGAVAALKAAGYPARTSRVVLSVASMSCASCVGRVDQALAEVPGVVAVSVNLAAETATVDYLDGVLDIADLKAASAAIGYPATVAEASDTGDRVARKSEEAEALRRRVILAAALAVPVFVLEMGGHLFPAFHHFIGRTIGIQTSWVIQFVLASIVLFGPGWSFFSKGVPALLRRAPDMNSLVALGTGAAWGYSVVATFLPGVLPVGTQAVYFESAAIIVVLILVGRWLEARAKGRTGAAIQKLIGMQVKTARVLRNGEPETVSVEELQPGDVLLIRPGERVPTDGVVTDGESNVDESMITGEPVPVSKASGNEVTGGTVNGTGLLTVRAERVGVETTLAQIVRMVEDAQGAKLPIQGLVDRVTMWFVPAVLLIAAVTIAVWLAVGPDPALALVAGVSVLVIACPCAMGLATPTSIMVGTGRAAELGVLFRKGDALQALSNVSVIALDKTGTVTEGAPALTDVVLAEGTERAEVLRLIASVEDVSEHPIAAAIVQGARAEGIALGQVEGFASVTGFGVSGRVDGHEVRIGADRWMAREGVDTAPLAGEERRLAEAGKTALYAAVDGRLAAVLAVADPVKPASRSAVAALQALGFEVAMLTGDKQETAEAIARETGIDEVRAGLLPGEKIAALESLRQGERKIAFVGDGINDAPALAHADVGIAIGTGTDVAIESADVVLMSGDLRGVVNAVEVSRRTMTNIRQNLGWAFGYNTLLIPVAAGVLYPAFGLLLAPVFAAGAMAMSSVSVLANALRLRRIRALMDETPTKAAKTALVDQPAE